MLAETAKLLAADTVEIELAETAELLDKTASPLADTVEMTDTVEMADTAEMVGTAEMALSESAQ